MLYIHSGDLLQIEKPSEHFLLCYEINSHCEKPISLKATIDFDSANFKVFKELLQTEMFEARKVFRWLQSHRELATGVSKTG